MCISLHSGVLTIKLHSDMNIHITSPLDIWIRVQSTVILKWRQLTNLFWSDWPKKIRPWSITCKSIDAHNTMFMSYIIQTFFQSSLLPMLRTTTNNLKNFTYIHFLLKVTHKKCIYIENRGEKKPMASWESSLKPMVTILNMFTVE